MTRTSIFLAVVAFGEEVDQLSSSASQQKFRNDKQAQSVKQALEQASRNLRSTGRRWTAPRKGLPRGVAIAVRATRKSSRVGRKNRNRCAGCVPGSAARDPYRAGGTAS